MSDSSISLSVDKQALKATMICSTVLLFKCISSLCVMGGKRAKAGTRPPEDQSLFPNDGNQNFKPLQNQDTSDDYHRAQQAEQRWVRIGMNDLESIPMALALNWGSLLCCANAKVHTYLTITFCVARILHTWSYAYKKQPHRALFWFIAILSMLGFSINGCIGVL